MAPLAGSAGAKFKPRGVICYVEVDRLHPATHEVQFMPKPRTPVSRTKLAHHSLCGSERAHRSRDSKSRQYWRMPPWGGTTEKIMFSCKRSLLDSRPT